jgi:hypothetical protein
MLQARTDHTVVRRSERVQTGSDKSISGLNPKLDCGPVQGQMPNHGLDQGPVQKGSGSNRGSGLNCGKPTDPCLLRLNTLPDDILLPIFDSYLHILLSTLEEGTRAWQSLIHVCRRWQSVVFRSPHRLDLQLFCTESTHSRDMLLVP